MRKLLRLSRMLLVAVGLCVGASEAWAQESKSVSITDAGWATLYTDVALDFSGVTGLKAYTATLIGNQVSLTKVNDVPAETGVVLKGKEGDYTIPTISESLTEKGSLRGSATNDTDVEDFDGYTFYVLAMYGDQAQFRRASSGLVPAGKAYLMTSASEARSLDITFSDATGIEDVEKEVAPNDGAYYNMAGQRVAHPTKGLYIVNGKKVIIK